MPDLSKGNVPLPEYCNTRYGEWFGKLITMPIPPSESDYPQLITEDMWARLTGDIGPSVVEAVLSLAPIENLLEGFELSIERNVERERIITAVAGHLSPLRGLEKEKVRRKIRSAIFDILIALQKGDYTEGIKSLEENMAPRAWKWINSCYLRDLPYRVDHITHLETDLGDKLASINPLELAFAAGRLSFPFE